MYSKRWQAKWWTLSLWTEKRAEVSEVYGLVLASFSEVPKQTAEKRVFFSLAARASRAPLISF